MPRYQLAGIVAAAVVADLAIFYGAWIAAVVVHDWRCARRVERVTLDLAMEDRCTA